MKLLTSILFLAMSSTYAANIKLNDHNFSLTDIASRGMDRQDVFESMDTKDIKLGSSICSNRALMWTYELKRKQNIDAAKIFVFYTGKVGDVGRKKWWYHVAPVINENSTLYVADPGFEQDITGPQLIKEWLHTFAGTSHCKEITPQDTDLIKLMYKERWYPKYTSHGYYSCYYMITPGMFWTPGSIAEHYLGVNDNGEKVVKTDRSRYHTGELVEACEEATTGKVGRWFSDSEKSCKKRIGR